MAQIAAAPSNFGQQPPPLMGVAAGAPVNAQNTVNDPLFEALVKYVTSGYNAVPVSSSALQETLNTYSAAPGGRAYLEGLVQDSNLEQMPTFKAWNRHLIVNGWILISQTSLTLDFAAKQHAEVGIPLVANFHGTADGLFRHMWIPFNFDNARFCLNDSTSGDVTFELIYFSTFSSIVVTFTHKDGTEAGQLVIEGANLSLPSNVPIKGKGRLNVAM